MQIYQIIVLFSLKRSEIIITKISVTLAIFKTIKYLMKLITLFLKNVVFYLKLKKKLHLFIKIFVKVTIVLIFLKKSHI